MNTHKARSVDRLEAARLLRAAHVGGPQQHEHVEWAFLTLPDSRQARHLQIESLIEQGDRNAALALIGQGLLHRPTDPSLAYLRARCLYHAGEWERADGVLRITLARRPEHIATLELAGRVALKRRDPHRAAACFRQIDLRRPTERIKRLRVISLLRCRRPDLAKYVLDEIPKPDRVRCPSLVVMHASSVGPAVRHRGQGRRPGTCPESKAPKPISTYPRSAGPFRAVIGRRS